MPCTKKPKEKNKRATHRLDSNRVTQHKTHPQGASLLFHFIRFSRRVQQQRGYDVMTIYEALQQIEQQQCKFREGRSILSALIAATDRTDFPMTRETMDRVSDLTNAALTLWEDVPATLEIVVDVLAPIVHIKAKGLPFEHGPLTPEQQELIQRIATLPPDDIKTAYKRILWALEGWK